MSMKVEQVDRGGDENLSGMPQKLMWKKPSADRPGIPGFSRVFLHKIIHLQHVRRSEATEAALIRQVRAFVIPSPANVPPLVWPSTLSILGSRH